MQRGRHAGIDVRSFVSGYRKKPPLRRSQGDSAHYATGGFTLIEFSIVLVVIGLVIGAIFVGRDLIRAAEFRATVSDFEKFEAAFNTFRLRFNAIPGDDADATAYFGASTSNGNGDGNIYDHFSALSPDEDAKLWQHLSLAGLIPLGAFTSYYPHVVGYNMPAANIAVAHAGYRFQSAPPHEPPVPTYFYGGKTGLLIRMGVTDVCGDLGCPALSSTDAMNLDTKMDDGLPASGKLTGENYGALFGLSAYDACDVASTSLSDPGSNKYNLNSSGWVCSMNYWIIQ